MIYERKLSRVFLFQIYANIAISIYNIISRLKKKFFIVDKSVVKWSRILNLIQNVKVKFTKNPNIQLSNSKYENNKIWIFKKTTRIYILNYKSIVFTNKEWMNSLLAISHLD